MFQKTTIITEQKYNPDAQRLFFDDLINCREIGGMPTQDGFTVNRGICIRSGSPSLASPDAARGLINYGTTRVIDLRSEAEASNSVNPFRDIDAVDYHNIPLFIGNPDSDDDPTMRFLRSNKLGDFYILLLEQLSDRLVTVLKLINSNDGITLFHCAHGKDRTGVVAAILYLICNVSRENIITNYKVSYEYARHFLEPLIAAKEDCMKHTLRSDAENMKILLDYFDSKYNGDINTFLISAGMSCDDINSLRSKLIIQK